MKQVLGSINSTGVAEKRWPRSESGFCCNGQALYRYEKLFLRRRLSASFKDTFVNLSYFLLNYYFRDHGTIETTNSSSLVKSGFA